jgi:hypothetical protein
VDGNRAFLGGIPPDPPGSLRSGLRSGITRPQEHRRSVAFSEMMTSPVPSSFSTVAALRPVLQISQDRIEEPIDLNADQKPNPYQSRL